MTRTEIILMAIILLPWLPVTCLSGIALIVAIMPREHTRRLRHKLARFVLWQWLKGSVLSSILHDWLWREGNGQPAAETRGGLREPKRLRPARKRNGGDQ